MLLPLLVTANNARGRRRPGARTEATAVEEVTEKAAGPDQIAMASRTESSRYAMPSSYATSDQETENYPYELNLVRPESQFPTNPAGVSQYSFGNEERQVDDVETAEEYVAKAMQMYGSRLKEPIRITAENMPPQNKYDVFEAPEPETQTPAPIPVSAPVYEKDPVTRSYDVYDYSTYETVSEQQYEPKFETKYRYQPNNNAETAYVAPSMRPQSSSDNDRIKAAASSEIPKEEILKQIEKSVIKYMKEMEADGKIIPPSEPKTTYAKFQQAESGQRIQTTPKPKQTSFQYTSSSTRNQSPKIAQKPSASSQEETYSSSLQQELSESLAPNVEFIYKIKARAPLQSMQASRPYSTKIPVESFDHSAALKNMEEFDLSHVVQEERVATKPKLFFNSDIYQDINSLPYKPEKLVINRPQKTKEHPDYKGYALYTEAKPEEDSEDSGYPIMNPYQFVFKKEPSSSSSLVAQSSNWESSHNRPYSAPQKPQLEYDTYSPKYNNNPEGYGYQHQHGQSHKYQGRHTTKRGKRGGPHPHGKKGSRGSSSAKDPEANVALRPPPKV
ncbi:uncharacterized protein LOC129918956 isoform X2 [Episyrphus balteatus]|uniref:uncharacterized protein LOC129918956 isoform X2 n=1 Tax=Episyrphus balteatus TaxID=286459 RepID=UPI002485E24E|nr:uncharacterized protein LOC129918956 isoform X2 [Episyrphus balteatus]